jgi:outer membrane protein assembly factor BamC
MKMSVILRSSKIISLLMVFVLVSGCSWFGGKKSSGHGSRDSQSLEVPPELSQPRTSDAMAIPVVTAEQARSGSSRASQQVVNTALLPDMTGARIKQEGGIRWAELDSSPEVIWQESQGYFRSIGFEISNEDPKLGIFDTGWLSNRAYREIGFWRSLFGEVAVTGLKDRYRVRLERTDNPNVTRMYLSHQGLIEDVYEEVQRDNISRFWRWRPNDPELEAETLKRFLVFRGMDEEQAEQVTRPKAPVERARLENVSNGQIVVVNDNFAHTWRHAGVAIDRLGLTVTDRNRSEGLYYIEISDAFIEQHKEDSSLMKKWFGGDDEKKSNTTFVMKVTQQQDETWVSLHDQKGQLDNSDLAKKLNELLYKQLR